MRACTMPAFSTRYSILPPLASFTAVGTSNVTVPTFGFGMRPRGPRTRPSLPTAPIMSGVAMTRSKSRNPSETFATRSSLPAKSAPASRASRSFSPLANTRTRTVLPGPVRQNDRAADHLIGVLGIHAQTDREVDRLVELGELGLLDAERTPPRRCICAHGRPSRRPSRGFSGLSASSSSIGLLASHRAPDDFPVGGDFTGGARRRETRRSVLRCFSLMLRRRSPSSGRCPSRCGWRTRCPCSSCPASSAAASSRTCFIVTLPTLVLFGSFEPAPGFLLVGRPAAFLSSTLVGGVFRMNAEAAVGVDRDDDGDDHVARPASWR